MFDPNGLRSTAVFAAVVGLAAWGGLLAAGVRANGAIFEPGISVGTVQTASLNEASGIAASRQSSNVLWGHNDSGDSARIFAMNIQGANLGTYNLTGAGATDWEDMAIGPGPVLGQSYLYLGDIGDNNSVRSSITVYRVPEPAVSSTQTPVNLNLANTEAITLLYPDGARDAETLMVDPQTNDIYVVSKRESQSRIYRAAYPQSTSAAITMQYVSQLPWGWATGGDISSDGSEILIRGYMNASLWSRPQGGNLWDAFALPATSVPLVGEPQGEAIGFDAAGLGYFTTSEGTNQPIYYFARVPEPGTLTLLAMGAVVVFLCRKKLLRQ